MCIENYILSSLLLAVLLKNKWKQNWELNVISYVDSNGKWARQTDRQTDRETNLFVFWMMKSTMYSDVPSSCRMAKCNAVSSLLCHQMFNTHNTLSITYMRHTHTPLAPSFLACTCMTLCTVIITQIFHYKLLIISYTLHRQHQNQQLQNYHCHKYLVCFFQYFTALSDQCRRMQLRPSIHFQSPGLL